MKRIIIFIGMMACVLTVSAQDAVSAIRKHYTETQEMVKQYAEWEKEGEWTMPCPMYYEVNIKQNLPGTGYHKEWIRLYFYEKENEEWEADEPMLFRNIHFVTAKYNYAAREFYDEYLFDEKGNLEFIFARNADIDDFKGGEYRFYFKDGKLIKVIVSVRNLETEKYEQKYTGAKVPADYESDYNNYLGSAEHYKELFKTIDAGTVH
ncbi:MAG: hypothetical protein J6Y46_07045 [Prevotella sp.]|nr:hypothetical protein [Prevotella sp.]